MHRTFAKFNECNNNPVSLFNATHSFAEDTDFISKTEIQITGLRLTSLTLLHQESPNYSITFNSWYVAPMAQCARCKLLHQLTLGLPGVRYLTGLSGILALCPV